MNNLISSIKSFFGVVEKPHKHKWKYVRTDSLGGKIHICETCESEGALHSYHRGDMKILKWSDKAKSLPHEHEWCYEDRMGRKADAPENTPLSTLVSCGCGQWAVLHFGESEYTLLK